MNYKQLANTGSRTRPGKIADARLNAASKADYSELDMNRYPV